MTDTPAWDGRPLIRPEVDGDHIVETIWEVGTQTWRWHSADRVWSSPNLVGSRKAEGVAQTGSYVAAVLTPDDIAALLAAEKAKERKACMMICNVKAASYCSRDTESTDMRRGALSCAAAIRAMGETA